jgi:hypothetical protein
MPPIRCGPHGEAIMNTGIFGCIAVACAAVGLLGSTAARASDNAPVIAIPGRPDVPVIIDGRDASWAVVESDWGLYRPGWLPPTVIKPLCCNPPYPGRPVARYFPGTGRMPGYGRREFDPPQARRQRPAQPYSRSWSAESENLPATIMPPSYDVPPVVVQPFFGGRGPGPR